MSKPQPYQKLPAPLGPDEFESIGPSLSGAHSAFRAVLAMPCARHDAAPREPCWTVVTAPAVVPGVCGERIRSVQWIKPPKQPPPPRDRADAQRRAGKR